MQTDDINELKSEITKLKGIIARNAMQRLKGEDATEMFITADDIKNSLEVLYEWQITNIHKPRKHHAD